MAKAKSITRAESAQVTKKTILDAAENLFAQKGFEATSLQEICDAAGVARGTPGYFFGSKEQLYRAVLERTFSQSHSLVTFRQERELHPEQSPQQSFKIVVEQLFDFFVANPNFVRITSWEALSGGAYLGQLPILLDTLSEAVKVLQDELGWQSDVSQFLVDLVALIWFPLAQAQVFMRALDVNAYEPEFLQKRKQHIFQMLLDNQIG